MSRLPEEIKNMKLLWYLGLRRTGVNELPTSISELQYLQTLDMRNYKAPVIIPSAFFKIKTLRYVQADIILRSPSKLVLHDLRTLEIVATNWIEEWKFPKLQKLSLAGVDRLPVTSLLTLLAQLNHLVVLKLSHLVREDAFLLRLIPWLLSFTAIFDLWAWIEYGQQEMYSASQNMLQKYALKIPSWSKTQCRTWRSWNVWVTSVNPTLIGLYIFCFNLIACSCNIRAVLWNYHIWILYCCGLQLFWLHMFVKGFKAWIPALISYNPWIREALIFYSLVVILLFSPSH